MASFFNMKGITGTEFQIGINGPIIQSDKTNGILKLPNSLIEKLFLGSSYDSAKYINSTDYTGNAATATKLKSSRSLWGQSFDGSKDISGDITSTGTITPSKTNTSNIGSSGLSYNTIYVNNIGNSLLPTANETYNLGSENFTWKTVYADSILPSTDNSTDIGSLSKKYKEIFATTFNGNATSATKAIGDGDGRDIRSTYWSLTSGTAISESSNLDSLTSNGNYYCSTATISATLTNSPTNEAFILKVFYGDGTINVVQEVCDYPSIKKYVRSYDSVNKKWSSWKCVENDLTKYVSKSGDTMTGALNVPTINDNNDTTQRTIATGTDGNSYFQARKFRGQGDASTYNHAIDFGYEGHDRIDFYEYGGTFNFWANRESTKLEGDANRVASLQSGKLVERGNTLTYPGKSGTIALTDDITAANVGLSDVVNTGDSATPEENGTTKFTTGGAYALQTAIKDNTDNIKSINIALGSKQDKGNYIKYTTTEGVNVAGTTKSISSTSPGTLFVPYGLIMGGTALAAGLTTRGICGVSTPDSTGACSKSSLFLNYDGDDNYNRTVVLGAGSAGEKISGGAYTHGAVRGDQMTLYVTDAISGKQDALTFDTTPTKDSSNPVTSDGIKKYVDDEVGKCAKTSDGNTFNGNQTFNNDITIKNDANINGSLTVSGNLTISGTTTTVNSTTLEISDNLITLAKGNTTALTSPSGMVVPKYDGENTGALVFDADGIAYVGDVTLDDTDNISDKTNLQTIATRTGLVNGNLIKYDSAKQTLVDAGIAVSNIPSKFTKTGSSTLPVYIDNDGKPQPISSYSGNAATATKATSADKLNSDAGSVTTPVYFSNGKPVVITSYSGNSATASKWAATKSFTIKDSDKTNSGTAVNVDGSSDVVLTLPTRIKATLDGKSTNTNYLDSPATSRLTSSNISSDHSTQYTGYGRMRLDLATSSMTTAKPIADGFIQTYFWDNSGHDSQLYLPINNTTNHIQFRTAGTPSNGLSASDIWKSIAWYDDISTLTTSITPSVTNEYNLGSSSNYFSNGYLTNIYTTKLTGTGNISVGQTLYPGTTENYSLGTSSNKWLNVYAKTIAGDMLSGTLSKKLTIKVAGTEKAVFNNSADKTVNITLSDLGGAASNHTHTSLIGHYWTSEVKDDTNDSAQIVPATGELTFSSRILAGAPGMFDTSNNANCIISMSRHSGNFPSQLGFSANGNIYYRYKNSTALTKDDTWKTLAFTDSTVASANKLNVSDTGSTTKPVYFKNGIPTVIESYEGNAESSTKLKTARKLWGQSFDGSADVSGAISDTETILPSATSKYNIGSSEKKYNKVYASEFNGTATNATNDKNGNDISATYWAFTGGTNIPQDADLNSEIYKIIGNYYCPADVTAATIVNKPSSVNNAFTMKVYNATGTSYKCQELHVYHNGVVYKRVYMGSSWSGWILVGENLDNYCRAADNEIVTGAWDFSNNGVYTNTIKGKFDRALQLYTSTQSGEINLLGAAIGLSGTTSSNIYRSGLSYTTDGTLKIGTGTLTSTAFSGSAAKVANSLTIKLNSGSGENTNLFTFNGSSAKTINITASGIGAATTSAVTSAAKTVGATASTAKQYIVGVSSTGTSVQSYTNTLHWFKNGILHSDTNETETSVSTPKVSLVTASGTAGSKTLTTKATMQYNTDDDCIEFVFA